MQDAAAFGVPDAQQRAVRRELPSCLDTPDPPPLGNDAPTASEGPLRRVVDVDLDSSPDLNADRGPARVEREARGPPSGDLAGSVRDAAGRCLRPAGPACRRSHRSTRRKRLSGAPRPSSTLIGARSVVLTLPSEIVGPHLR